MVGPVRFVFTILWIAIGLSSLGTLKACTNALVHKAASSQQGKAISLGEWNRRLNGEKKQ